MEAQTDRHPVLEFIVGVSHYQEVSKLARTLILTSFSIGRLSVRILFLTNHRNLLIFHAGPSYLSSLVDRYRRISQHFILAGRSQWPLTYARYVLKPRSAYYQQ